MADELKGSRGVSGRVRCDSALTDSGTADGPAVRTGAVAKAVDGPGRPKPSLRTALGDAALLVAVPVVLALCAYFQIEQAGLLTLMVTAAALGLFFFRFERAKPGLRQAVPTAVLGALAAAGRILFAAVPDVKPVSAVCILAGAVFGRRSGFMVGAIAALVSNFFFGQGEWTPWQMYAWGLVGYLAGVLADHGAFGQRGAVYVYGLLSALLYGFFLNSFYVVGYIRPFAWPTVMAAYGAGFGFDVVHGVATAAFLLVIYAPWRRKLERIKRKYALA